MHIRENRMNIQMKRRQFLLTAAAAAGATWFDIPQILANEPGHDNKKYGGFPMGIQSYSLRGFGVDGALEIIEKKLGLHYVEFFNAHYPQTLDEGKIKEMKEKLKKHKIAISCHGVQGFNDDHKRNELFFQFAKASGIRNISADPAPNSFESLDKLVKKYDIRIAIHNHGPRHRYNTPEDSIKAVEKWDKRIGYCADLGHYIRSGFDPVDVVNKLGARLYGIHLKDFAEKKDSTKGVIIGKGHMDVQGVFAALKKHKFPADGALSLEYEENPKDPVAEIQECLHVAAEAAQKVAKAKA